MLQQRIEKNGRDAIPGVPNDWLDAGVGSAHDLPRLKNKAASIFLILAAAFAVYWPSLQNGFVWDDTALVLRDPFVRSWRLIPEGFRHFLFTDATASDFYRPLQRLTYTADYAFYGFAPWGYHLTNLILHALAGVALFFFLEQLILQFQGPRNVNARRLALLASLLWVVHPIHSAAVIYIAGRADLLAALFGFAGLYFALRRSAQETEPSFRTQGTSSLPALCFLAALLSKESGIAALATCLLILAFKRTNLRSWLIFVPLIFLVYFGLRFSAERTPVPHQASIGLAARPILMARALGEYAGLLLMPVSLHMERDLTGVGWQGRPGGLKAARLREFQTLLGVLLALGFGLWLRWIQSHSKAGLLCLLGFLVAYLPVSNLFTLNATAAEHWLYVPSAYLIAAALLSLACLRLSAAHCHSVKEKNTFQPQISADKSRINFSEYLRLSAQSAVKNSLTEWQCSAAVLTGVYAAFLLLLGTRTFLRNPDWKDQKTFVQTTIADGGDSVRMLLLLGAIQSNEGRPAAALTLAQEALHRMPNQPVIQLNLAKAYLQMGEFQKARDLLKPCLESPDTRPQALLDLTALEFRENHRERLDLLSEAAELSPKMWPIRKRYITGLAQTGQLSAAVNELRRLLEEQPYRAESWQLLGDLLQKSGRPELAKQAYSQAADYDVHLKLTKVFSETAWPFR